MTERENLDVELTMHLFRLMRSHNYRTAAELLAAAKEDFPEVAEERIRSLAASLARKIVNPL